jgi:Transglycosylase SLT domain
VLRSRRIIGALASAGAITAGLAIAALPSASADEQCVVTVTLLGGVQIPFTIDVPPGTPLTDLSLPGVNLPILSESESCPQAAPATPAPTTSAPTTSGAPTTAAPSTATPSTQSTSASSTSSSSSATKNSKSNKKALSGAVQGSVVVKSATPQSSAAVKNGQAPLRTSNGVPTAQNPTYSFALPTPAPIGVPNFFIDSFQIPPALLPIYQAAGIQYNVPWQVLAAINDIETDYGRNLSISSAGAEGWMQFIPSTWAKYGVNATDSAGPPDPYNPVDAIFAAARYLNAAGASKNLGKAIFSYNHANWYVQSVLLRAKLIEGIPEPLIGALSGLVEGHFPVAAPATYADDDVERLATRRVHTANAAEPVDSSNAKSIQIFAKQGSPLIAVNDGKIVAMGYSKSLGHYLELQDTNGNTYTYAQMGSISKLYAVPKPVKVTAKEIAQELSSKPAPTPTGPATAGSQSAAAPSTPATVSATSAKAAVKAAVAKPAVKAATTATTTTTASKPATTSTQPSGSPKVRLFANPSRPASFASGGQTQLDNSADAIESFQNYFSDTLHLAKNQYTLQPLRVGSKVVAGTVLGHIGTGTATDASHLLFMIRPAGRDAPLIDPKVILDGWELLQESSIYRAASINPFVGADAKNPTIGQVLLMSKSQLQQVVLADPHVEIYSCGRRDIEAGEIDRRILATMEFLSQSGLDPTVSGLKCGQSSAGNSSPGSNAVGTGDSMEISAINGIPIQGHQGTGSITDLTIRRLLTLQGAMRPDQIISLMSYPGQTNTLALPDHSDRLQVAFTPLFGQNKKISAQVNSILKPQQWIKLIDTISQIPEPTIPTTTINPSGG